MTVYLTSPSPIPHPFRPSTRSEECPYLSMGPNVYGRDMNETPVPGSCNSVLERECMFEK